MTGTMMWLEMLVVALVTLELTDSPFLVSVTFFLRFIPMLFGFGIGVIAERLNRKYLMTVGLAVQAATSAVLAALIISDQIEYWHLALGSFLIGAVMASEFPVRRTMIGEVVSRSSVGRAVSLEQTTNSLFRILGPFIGGVFLATIGAQGGFLLGVILYSIGVLIALSMKYSRPTTTEAPAGPKTQIIEGVRYIRKSQVMIGTLGVTLILNVFGFSYMSQQPVVAKQVLQVSDVLIGILQSVEGAGAFIGATLIVIFAKPHHYTRIYMWGSLLFIVAIVLFSQSTNYWLTLIILFFGGMGMSGFATMQSAIMIYVSSPKMRGRVLGSVAVFIGIGPFGQLGIGALANILDPATAVLITALTGIVFMFIAFVLYPAMNKPSSLETDAEAAR
ncbi:MFS transporter [Candidatus Lucifugimonas marina]|uniref:MFS transporter n=2 Tax=Candidatus Lucifugimonas marina TaxID=3038979 RepID=A0AAJ6CQX9_9CHLR|nr:MFS transporter [SAR202 cluster bacterium JH702]MDG0870697.1 MFS transporter [SAR202 cluster bacterium JH639]WFG34781.1 MFS transporter [SAR202 cluster bacterium JH545]WFG38721.1 MFS transporter [SAR202 cluster bacterium JH1073]